MVVDCRGDGCVAAVTGDRCVAAVTGDRCVAAVTGGRCVAAVTGGRCVAAVTGGRRVHTCAGAHGLGDDLQLVRGGLVLHAAVVLEEELAGLLQNTTTLADGTEAQTEVKQF